MTQPKVLFIHHGNDERSDAIADRIDAAGTTTCFRTTLTDLINGNQLPDPEIQTLIFDCRYMDRYEFACVLKIRQFAPSLPIVITAEQIALDSYRRIDQLHNAVTLQKPFHDDMLFALLKKLGEGREATPAVSPRFITDAEVRLLVIRSGLMIQSRMRNYSAGGAFIEYRGISLQVGDQVRISVPGPVGQTLQEFMHLHARIVWLRDGDGRGSVTRGVGLQFIDPPTAATPGPTKKTPTQAA